METGVLTRDRSRARRAIISRMAGDGERRNPSPSREPRRIPAMVWWLDVESSQKDLERDEQRQPQHACLQEVLRLTEIRAQSCCQRGGLDLLEDDIAVRNVEYGELSLELAVADLERLLGAQVELIPAILELRVRRDQVEAGRL